MPGTLQQSADKNILKRSKDVQGPGIWNNKVTKGSLEKIMIKSSLGIVIFRLNLPSVQFSCSVVSDSLQPHGLQHARPPCPSPTLRVYSNSCPLSRWCHPTILSFVVPFSSHLQSFPVSGSLLMGRFFASGGQRIVVSASAPVLPKNIQDSFPLGWAGWTSLQSKRLSRVFSNGTVQSTLVHSFCIIINNDATNYELKVQIKTFYMLSGHSAGNRWSLCPILGLGVEDILYIRRTGGKDTSRHTQCGWT